MRPADRVAGRRSKACRQPGTVEPGAFAPNRTISHHGHPGLIAIRSDVTRLVETTRRPVWERLVTAGRRRTLLYAQGSDA